MFQLGYNLVTTRLQLGGLILVPNDNYFNYKTSLQYNEQILPVPNSLSYPSLKVELMLLQATKMVPAS